MQASYLAVQKAIDYIVKKESKEANPYFMLQARILSRLVIHESEASKLGKGKHFLRVRHRDTDSYLFCIEIDRISATIAKASLYDIRSSVGKRSLLLNEFYVTTQER